MMAEKPSLDLQQFRGCQTGLAAFVGKNLERLLLHSLANQALAQEDDPQLVADILKYTNTDLDNLKHIINFITKVQGSETLTISLLDYEPLTQYIRWSFDRLQSSIILSGDEKTQAKAAENRSGIELLEAIRATSQPVQDELFRNILAFNVSATKGTKAALGELMKLFQKDIINSEQRRNENFLCFTSALNGDAELQSAIVESAKLCLKDTNLLKKQKRYFKSVIDDSPDLNSGFDSLEGELLVINLVTLSLRKQRLEKLFGDLRKECLQQDPTMALGIFINSLRHSHNTKSKIISIDSQYLLSTMRGIASDLSGQSSDNSEIKEYFDAISAAGDDIVEKISLSDNPSVSLTNARDELLCGVMHNRLEKIGNVPSCNCTKEQASFMATEKHLIKLNRNRNLRVHYKQYDPKTIAQGGDVWLEQDDVKKFYETIIDSRFFKLTYSYVTEEEDFRKIKEQYFTFEDIESLNEMLSSCVYRLQSTINVDSEYESLDQLKKICEQKIDDYWRAADSDLSTKMVSYYTAQKIATGKIAIHKRGNETWRAVSSNHLTADNFGEVLRSKNDPVPKSLLKRLAVRKVARFPVASAEQYRAFYMHNHPDVREGELKYPGFESIPGHPYLGGTPDAVLDINGKKVLLIFYNMRNNKKAAKSKALQNENVPYKLNDEDPKGRSLYHESIGLAKAHGAEECHVVIFGKCECPNGECIPSSAECLAVVEVDVKAELSKFDTNMAPKLREFYFSVLLPELALPRKAKGFRKEPFADWNQLFPQQNNEQ